MISSEVLVVPPVSQRVPRRTFEALLRPEVAELTPALEASLQSLGLDPRHLADHYDLPTLRAVTELIRQQECAALSFDDGLREVGRRFVKGFKQTPIGWIFNTMAPFFGPARTLQQLPRYLTSVREEFPLTVVTEGETRFRLICLDAEAMGAFMAGCIEGVLDTCGVSGALVHLRQMDQGFELEISW